MAYMQRHHEMGEVVTGLLYYLAGRFLPPSDRANLEDMTRRIVNKLLHHPVRALRGTDGQRGGPGHLAYLPAMATLTVRNLPDEALAKLRVRAAHHGRSMEAEARDLLVAMAEQAEKPKSSSAGLIPIVHGLGAVVTFALAVVTAAGMR